jgi:hypothetical protein
MAQIVKLRRSSVSGQKPTNSNLQLGELALNTTDGKVYMAKSGSLGPTVEELISTNTVNTGSIHLVGDITGSIFTGSFKGDGSQLYNIPLSGVTNLTTISGSFDDRLDILEAYSGSQLVPSSSMSFRTLQTDVYCKNTSGTQINKGTVVRIVGSVGDNPLIGVASFLTEGQSANTLGIAAENIPNDGFGLVITEGVLTGVNTNGMTAGQLLFLGANGTFTTSYPVPPNHGVRLGEVLRVQQNQGSIYVRVDNGAELGEAHDVYDTTTNSSYGDLLVKSGSVWVNSRSLNGNYAVTGSLTITQNLTVLGSSSLVYVTSSNLAVSASFISVNVFEPAERFGGLKVYDSGSSNATASLAWDSQKNHWVYQNASGSSYSGGMLLSGPRNTGSLGDEIGLIDGRIAKSVGGDHLDNSIISETGTTITVLGNLVADSITGSFDFYGLVNRPTLVSGSSQIDITGTTGYSTFSSSINDSINVVTASITDLSSSIATTTNDLDGRLDSIEGVTGSYATTGSNHFNGDQTITGSLNVLTKVITDELYVSGNVYFGNGDLTDRIVIKSYFSTSLIPDSDGDHYLGQSLKRWANIYSSTGSFNNLMGNGGSTINIFDAVVTGSFTGSFNGDGGGLYNIPASGVTGLQLDKIISGNASASIDNSGLYVNRNVYVDGTITAKEIYIDYVTSSVLYESGSTKFGDTLDDTHQFTGSVYISGSIISTGTDLVSGSSQINITGTTGYSTFSSSIKSSIDVVTGSITDLSSSVKTRIDTVTGSITDLSSSVKSRIDVVTSSITDLSSSVKSRIDVVTGSITDLSSSVKTRIDTVTGSITDLSSSVKVRIDTITGSITNINSDIDSLQLYTGALDNFTSSLVLNSQTSSMTVLSSSYALTASYALNGGGGGTEGRTAKLVQSSASTTWTFNHNLGEQYPAITIFDSNDNVVIPTTINAQDDNTLLITFSLPQSGTASATVGGGLPYISGSFQGRVLAVENNAPVWKAGIISGSLQASSFGFATTGSNTFKGDQYVSGSIIIGNSASIGSKCVTISSNTQIVSLSPFDGANFDYVVKNGLNMRTGVIMSAWNGSNAIFNESSTMDLGSTSGITFTVSSVGSLNAVVTSGTWTVEVLYRALGCGFSLTTPTPTPTNAPTSTPTPTPTPTPGSTNYLISSGFTISEPCNGLFGNSQTVYGDSNDWTSVTRFYTNSGMTTPFNGNSLYYGDSNATNGTTLQIDSSGYVINFYAC